jgi:hypothetical protein
MICNISIIPITNPNPFCRYIPYTWQYRLDEFQKSSKYLPTIYQLKIDKNLLGCV